MEYLCSGERDLAQRQALYQNTGVLAVIEQLQDWPGEVISSHSSARQYFHLLSFLAEIGVGQDHPGIQAVISTILSSLDENGVPTLHATLPGQQSDSGREVAAWALCDAPVTLYALHRMGVKDPRLDQGTAYLAETDLQAGYPCRVSAALGAWRGPGRKSDPCPYATLSMLKLLTRYPGQYRKQIESCAAVLLELWQNSRVKHPYIFYMGTDFRKLKLPFVWYDILHVTEVLSRVPAACRDPRLSAMFQVVQEKFQSQEGRLESVYLYWKSWDFGQKKQPSDYLKWWVDMIHHRLAGSGMI